VQTYEKTSIDGETRGQWYLRQMLGSANISGNAVLHFMTGNLSQSQVASATCGSSGQSVGRELLSAVQFGAGRGCAPARAAARVGAAEAPGSRAGPWARRAAIAAATLEAGGAAP
jgi:hypothetical protein